VNEQVPAVLLSRRVLLLVAHPDDESIGAGILMQRTRRIHTVFATAGAPNRPYIWRQFGTPGRCARIRKKEASAALAIAQVPEPAFLGFPDGKLYRNLVPAYRQLAALLTKLCPQIVLTHAYEGGHPDHDACSFLASRLAKNFGMEAWEMPYYRPGGLQGSALVLQQFLPADSEEFVLAPTAAEVSTKREMFAAHKSQKGVLADFDPGRECFRAQPAYDYSKLPIESLHQVGPARVPARALLAAFQRFSFV
jgi:LmbE family N-acetylglucosaminyl deacetylase